MTPMNGPIGPVSRRLEPPDPRCDRSGEHIRVCWERVSKVSTTRGVDGAPPLCRAGIPAEQEWLAKLATKQSLLFVFGDAAPASALKAMCDAADRGARVYVLAKPGFGEGQQEHGLRDRPKAKVLVRRCAHLPFSAALGSDGDIASIWLCEAALDPSWFLSLNPEQASGLRATVLHWWWHEAEDEGWSEPGHKAPLSFRPLRDRAFDAPAPRTGPVRLVQEAESLDPTSVCVCPVGQPPTNCRRVFTPPRGSAVHSLESAARAGCEILWTALGLPKTSISEAAGVLEWSAGSRRVILSLDGAQRQILTAVLSTTPPEWRLRIDAKLGELSGDILLPDATSAIARMERHEVPCGSVQCEQIAGVLTCQPAAFPNPPVLARSVVYSWTALPPKLPGKARKSSLYDQWAHTDQALADRVLALLQALEQSHNRSTGFKERLKSFAAQAMGFQSGWERLSNDLAAMKQLVPSSLRDSDVASLSERFADVTRRTEEFCDGVDRDGLKAEESEQRADWESETRRRKQDLLAVQQQRKEVLDRQQAAQGELDTGEKAAVADSDWKAKRAALKDEIDAMKRTAATLAGKAGEHSAWLEKEKDFRFRPHSAPATVRDKGRKFAPSKPNDARLIVPVHSLPKVGVLYDHDNARYLSVKRWEDVQTGEQEARRLEAKLVVD